MIFFLIDAYCSHLAMLLLCQINIECYVNAYKHDSVIINGEFNAEIYVWGQNKLGNRGQTIIDSIIRSNINILNDYHTPPTYSSVLGNSWIDIVLFNNIL